MLRLLLVEDNDGDAILFRELLGSAPFTVTRCATLKEALDYFQDKNFPEDFPDLIVCDLNLPDSAGLETASSLMSYVDGRSPLIVLTGVEEDHFGSAAVKYGAQDYLVKGRISSYLLEKAIRYAIDRHRTLKLIEAQKELAVAHSQILESLSDKEVPEDLRKKLDALMEFMKREATS